VFAQTIKNLALASREMGSLMNRVNATPISPENSTDSDVLHEAYDLIPIFCDLNLVYLRRLPERLLMAMRPVLFANFQSSPSAFKNVCSFLSSSKLASAKPICDIELLKLAFREQTGWFDRLRSVFDGKKGLRDTIEHTPSIIHVTRVQYGDQQPKLEVQLASYYKDGTSEVDMVAVLREIIAGFCEFSASVVKASGLQRAYASNDCLVIMGNDEDSTTLWPAI
jgi:hypothetical protein